MKKEIQNLNEVLLDLKNENETLKEKINDINEQILDVKIKKPNIIEITDFVDEIKNEIKFLSNKVEKINNTKLFKEINDLEKNIETENFLKSINIDKKIINILLFLNYTKVSELCQLNVEELSIYNIDKNTSEYIIKKACEHFVTLI